MAESGHLGELASRLAARAKRLKPCLYGAIDNIVRAFGRYSATTLNSQTCQRRPWGNLTKVGHSLMALLRSEEPPTHPHRWLMSSFQPDSLTYSLTPNRAIQMRLFKCRSLGLFGVFVPVDDRKAGPAAISSPRAVDCALSS